MIKEIITFLMNYMTYITHLLSQMVPSQKLVVWRERGSWILALDEHFRIDFYVLDLTLFSMLLICWALDVNMPWNAFLWMFGLAMVKILHLLWLTLLYSIPNEFLSSQRDDMISRVLLVSLVAAFQVFYTYLLFII